MTKVQFETATLADVVKRAAAVAPTRGDAFDRTAGIIMSIVNGTVTIMATDTTVFYMEAVHAEGRAGDTVDWRFPSIIFSAIISKLPMGSGSTVTIDDESEVPRVVLRCGKTVAKFNLLDMKYYPMWNAVASESLNTVVGFGAAVKQVLWATSNAEPLLAGVCLLPDGVCATDRYRAAKVELDLGLTEEMVVPGKILSQVIPDNGEVQIGQVGQNFMICPNPYIQIRTVLMGDKFPAVTKLLDQSWEMTSHFSKSEFLPMVTRALDFATGDRQAAMTVFIGKGEIALWMDNSETALFGDRTDASGDAETHKRHKINFNPQNLRDSVSTFPGEVVTMKYNVNGGKPIIGFTNEGNYVSLVVPLRPPVEEES